MPYIIDGKAISKQIKDELRDEVEKLTEAGINACLAVIQVGNDPASTAYVNNKKKACAYVGINSRSYELPEDTSEQTLLDLVQKLNEDPEVNGILVQLPLPKQIDEDKVIRTISPDKDVDGFHPVSVGRLWIGEKGFLSCTPAGVIQLLKRSGIEIEGKECVIIGRSNIVGKPMAIMLLEKNATVTVAHSKTKNLKELALQADVIVAAVGKESVVTADMVKPGAAVIDVGMNRNAEGKLCGDVDTEEVAKVAGYISPVPGGVGPMTIAMLLSNTVEAYEKRLQKISR